MSITPPIQSPPKKPLPVVCHIDIFDSNRGEAFGGVKAYLPADAYQEYLGGPIPENPDEDYAGHVLVGYVHFSEYEGQIWIKYVFVAPEYRRRGVATAMYNKIKEEFPGANITSSGTTDEGGKFRKSLKQKGIVALTMDYGQVVNILHELMKDVKPGLPEPELKIANHTNPVWLGQCRWTHRDPNTVVVLQKSVCVDVESLKKVMAHELAHHEEFLAHWALIPDYKTYRMMKTIEGSHGKTWRTIAGRWNAKYGPDFVTKISDVNAVLGDNDNPFFVLLSRTRGRLEYKMAIRLSKKQKAYIARRTDETKFDEYYRLVVTKDRDFINGPAIGISAGWRSVRTPEMVEKFNNLWQQEDLRMSVVNNKTSAQTPPFITQDCWISRMGKVFPVGISNHNIVAYRNGLAKGQPMEDTYPTEAALANGHVRVVKLPSNKIEFESGYKDLNILLLIRNAIEWSADEDTAITMDFKGKGYQKFRNPEEAIDWLETGARSARPAMASHKQTQNRENTFVDIGQGEGTNGYANQPEKVEGTTTGLSLPVLEEQNKIGSNPLLRKKIRRNDAE